MAKVLYWIENFLPSIGGLEILSDHLMRNLRNYGHEFCIITSSTKTRVVPSSFQDIDLPIYRFPFLTTFASQNLRDILAIVNRIQQVVDDFKPDIIHIHTQCISLFFIELFLKKNPKLAQQTPIIFSVHSPVVLTAPGVDVTTPASSAVKQESILLRLLSKAEWVVAVSDAIAQQLCSFSPEIKPRVLTILNGLPLPSLEPTPLEFDPPRVLCLGRFIENKGFHVAIQAFSQVVSKFPRAKLVMAGNGPEFENLHQQVDTLNLSANVAFLSWVEPEQVPALINSCTMMLVPSIYEEPFGLVALQGNQIARPVIASRVGGLPEVIKSEVTGLLVDPHDAEQLATAIISLLKQPDKAIEMGVKGRSRSQREFSLERCVKAHDALYQSPLFHESLVTEYATP